MSVSQPSLTLHAVAAAKNRAWLAPLLGLSTGVLGGAIQSKILSAPMSHSILLGGIFGLAFSLFFARRATTPGAGLIWGLGGALLLWFVMPTGIDLLFLRSASSMAMLNDAQARFPQLVAYLVCLGMPVGVVLGIRGGLRTNEGQPQFRWGRAVVAGGLAGTIGGLAFRGWEYAGGYLPLLEGLPDFQSQTRAVILHFLVALLIGSIFGVLFQRDVRGYGSSMGWGLGFGIFLWFLGPLTVFPIVGRQPLDWSAEQGTALFGSLVGYIIYGFILGTIYAFLDRIWVRLFIQSDPLNREPEGLARKTHQKASKAASFFCKFLVFNKLNFTKRTPLRWSAAADREQSWLFQDLGSRKVEVDFGGGYLSSDGGGNRRNVSIMCSSIAAAARNR